MDAFELWCWRKLLRVPWTAKRSNQSILKEISPEYSLEGLMLKLKIWTFGHLMQRTNSLEKTPMLRKTEGRRREDRGWDGWMASSTPWTWVWASSRSYWWTGKPGVLQSMGWQRVGHNWATELNWRQFTDVPICTVMSPLMSLNIYVQPAGHKAVLDCQWAESFSLKPDLKHPARLPWWSRLRLWALNEGGPGSIPGQGNRSCMSQWISHILQLRRGAVK